MGEISTSDAKCAKAWDAKLRLDVKEASFFSKRFISEGLGNIVNESFDLTKKAGDELTVGISKTNNEGFLPSGTKVSGNEGKGVYFHDKVIVTDKNFGIVSDSTMSDVRAFFDANKARYDALVAQAALNDDKEFFKALDSQNTSVVYTTAGNMSATATMSTATAAVTAADKLSTSLLTNVKPMLISGFSGKQSAIEPLMLNGQAMWVCLVHPDALAGLENSQTFIQARRDALNLGKDNPIFTGAFAVWNQFIIHAHSNIEIGTNSGSIPYAKCHILGKNALIRAWAKKPVIEKKKPDYENDESGWGYFSVYGVKKTQFNSKDYGSVNLVVARDALSDITYS